MDCTVHAWQYIPQFITHNHIAILKTAKLNLKDMLYSKIFFKYLIDPYKET